ncbi:hypothetical protein PWT90_11081 [Aphanocladium album]|nr:hypothetical protein PWT90_11081 [Aphanocladium album]
MSSADTTPISPARFAAALKDLSVPMLHLKVLEIRNSIAHLQYSNDQLKPFADGTASATDSETTAGGEPDQDCVEAIRENEQVMERMAERIALIKREVEEERGVSWQEFQSKEETEAQAARAREEQAAAAAAAAAAEREEEEVTGVVVNGNGNGVSANSASSPWTDGTFQTGTIRNGEVHLDAQAGVRGATNGGSLSDEQLRAALEERMRQMTTGDEEDGGLHL